MCADRSGILSVGGVGPLSRDAGERKEPKQVLGTLPGEQAPLTPQLSEQLPPNQTALTSPSQSVNTVLGSWCLSWFQNSCKRSSHTPWKLTQ